MVYTSTTHDFNNIYPTTKKRRRDLQYVKDKTSPKTSPFLYPSPIFKSKPSCITCSIDNTDDAFTTINLPAKLKNIVQQGETALLTHP